MTYDNWKLADAEDRERFMRKLYRRWPWNPRQDVLDDYYEAEKADADMGCEEQYECERPGGCGAARNPVGRNHAAENAAAWYADIKRLLARLEDVSPDEREEIEREIQDGPLSVFVRDGWRSPYATAEGAEEYEILLSTGGPALRVYGRLGEHGEPVSAALQHQDWGTPWIDWYPEEYDSEVARVLLAYARCFSFGE